MLLLKPVRQPSFPEDPDEQLCAPRLPGVYLFVGYCYRFTKVDFPLKRCFLIRDIYFTTQIIFFVNYIFFILDTLREYRAKIDPVYKSIVGDGDAYLLELVRYIHLNPLRAGIIENVDSLENYPWCGHRELLGQTSRSIIPESKILPLFAKRRRAARQLYHRFIVDGAAKTSANFSSGGKRASLDLDPDLAEDALFDDRVLGGGDFVERTLGLADQISANKKFSLADLINLVAGHFAIEKALLSQPSKKRALTQAKAVICYVSIRLLKLKGVDIAPTLAYTAAAVSHAANRGEQIVLKEAELKAKLETIL